MDAYQEDIISVLMQDPGGVDHPVGCYSEKLLNYRPYSTVEEEALALLMSLSHFAVYVRGTGRSLEVSADHIPLVFLHLIKNAHQRFMRWCSSLQGNELMIKHVKGKYKASADTLSRVPMSHESA